LECDIPSIFLSGHQKDFLPSTYATIPHLAKPCTSHQLIDALRQANLQR